MLAVLRQRDFALLWLGGLVSGIGDWVLVVALPLYVYERTGSTLATGGVVAAQVLPGVLFGSLAGVFVDRWDRKRTMIAADLLRAAARLPLLAVQDERLLWVVYPALFAVSFVSLFFGPARGALVPRLIGEGHLMTANALNAVSDNVTRLVGPSVGGLLVAALGLRAAVLADSLSFVVSALLIAGVAVPRASGDAGAAPAQPGGLAERWVGLWRDWRDGLRFVAGDRLLGTVFLAVGAVLFGDSFLTALFIPWLKEALGGGGFEFGALLTARGAGGLVGAFLVARLSRNVPPERLFPLGLAGGGLVLLAMIGLPRLEVALAAMALFGVPAMLWFVSAQTLVQRGAPDHLRGRVLGAYGTTFGVAQLLGISAASVLGDVLGVVVLLVADGCLWLLAAGLAAVRLRRVHPGSPEQDAVVPTRS